MTTPAAPARNERTTIRIPALLPHQQVWARSPARFKLIRAGRRTGKDRLAFNVHIVGHGPDECPGSRICPRAPHPDNEPCFRGLLQGFDVVWAAPDYPQANLIWNEEIEPRFDGRTGVEMNRQEHTVSLQGAGTLLVRSSENIDSVRGSGARLGGVIINEAAHMDLEYVWKTVLRPALMDNKGWAIIMSTTNSGPDGNADKLVPSAFNRWCQEVESGKRGPPEWAHFYGTAFDNPKMDPKEVQSLIAEYASDSIALQEEVYAKLLAGGAGLAFPEWDDTLHTLPGDFHAPSHWRWAAGLDWGHATTAHGWFGLFAMGERGEAYGMDELYFNQLTATEAGRQIALKCVKLPVEYIAYDSAMSQDHGHGIGETIIEKLQQGIDDVYGRGRGPTLLPTVKGKQWRKDRKNILHEYLAYQRDAQGAVPPEWQPRLKFHRTCAAAIRTLPKLPVDKRDPHVVDTTAEDHPYDGITYYLMSRPQQPLPWQRPVEPHDHPGMDPATGRRRSKNVERMLAAAGLERPSAGFVPRGPTVEIEE